MAVWLCADGEGMYRFAASSPPYGSSSSKGLRMGGARLRDGAPWMGDGEAGQWGARGVGYSAYPRMLPPRSDRTLAYGLGVSSKMQVSKLVLRKIE